MFRKLTQTFVQPACNYATHHSDKLSQAILAKAFRGELVPTEAELARREGRDYEPASVLLERIKAEQAAKAGKQATKPTRGRKRAKRSHSEDQPEQLEIVSAVSRAGQR